MATYYHALLVVPGRIVHRKGRPLVDLGASKPLGLEWKSKPVRRAAADPRNNGQDAVLLIWPRTHKGKLGRASQVAGFVKPPLPDDTPAPGFYALGRLEAVNREEGSFELAILPNPEGRLSKPFTLTVWAGLELLEQLPPPGRGVRIRGELRPKSLRLVAYGAEEVPLPPEKEKAPESRPG